MAAGFPLFTDNHVRQQIVLGLRSRGWDVRWLREGRSFCGMVCWPQKHHQRMTDGGFIAALEDLARDPLAFAYPIRYIKTKL